MHVDEQIRGGCSSLQGCAFTWCSVLPVVVAGIVIMVACQGRGRWHALGTAAHNKDTKASWSSFRGDTTLGRGCAKRPGSCDKYSALITRTLGAVLGEAE